MDVMGLLHGIVTGTYTLETLIQWGGYVLLVVIVFTETGLLVGFFLPGDSLLVTAGICAWGAGWPIHWLILTLCIAAIVGDSVGYYIGRKPGPRLFHKENSWLFHKGHIERARAFYQKHGVKTIII